MEYQTQEKVMGNREYKSRLFSFVFGAEENKKYLLDLYNALNHSDYTNLEDLHITTIHDIIYMGMKNDLSFLFAAQMNLYEHQSTWNPNMPLRGFMYFGHMYAAYVKKEELDLYSRTLFRIPTPRFAVFYNGDCMQEDMIKLRLSDMFMNPDGSKEFEWTATVYNVNAGHNSAIMKRCKALHEYAEFVALVKQYKQSGWMLLEAVERAVDEAEHFQCLGAFFMKHRYEVTDNILTEYDEALHERTCRDEGKAEAVPALIETAMQLGMSLQDAIANAVSRLDMTEDMVKSIWNANRNA